MWLPPKIRRRNHYHQLHVFKSAVEGPLMIQFCVLSIMLFLHFLYIEQKIDIHSHIQIDEWYKWSLCRPTYLILIGHYGLPACTYMNLARFKLYENNKKFLSIKALPPTYQMQIFCCMCNMHNITWYNGRLETSSTCFQASIVSADSIHVYIQSELAKQTMDGWSQYLFGVICSNYRVVSAGNTH